MHFTGSFEITCEVNEQNVCTVAVTFDGAIVRLVWRSVEDRIVRSWRLPEMSSNSSDLPFAQVLVVVLNSPTHLSAGTFESAKSPRKRSARSASSFGELLT